MYSYKANDVNEALSRGLQHLLLEGTREDSRNGPVLVAPGPVCIEYTQPRNRVLYSATRDANPVFHFMESLWMLSGGNEIELPCFFNKSYAQFSDDGSTMWDAYGWRWRRFFGHDQLEAIVEELKKNPTSRRCVLSMWNSEPRQARIANQGALHPSGRSREDDFWIATHGGKAVPCNTHTYFAVRNGELNMTVMNRSNDAVWGAFGANAVHFSFLLEYMAMRIGVPMGSYFQFTNNLHTYTDKFSVDRLRRIEHESDTVGSLPEPGPPIAKGFDEDLRLFMPWAMEVIHSRGQYASVLSAPPCKTVFFYAVAIPMFLFWAYRKWNDEYSSHVCLAGIDAPDWQRACQEWVDRRRQQQTVGRLSAARPNLVQRKLL